MGLTMKEKKAVTRQIRSRYQKSKRKEKSDILNEFIQLTGYNRKYARKGRGRQSPNLPGAVRTGPRYIWGRGQTP
jgi:hypothetical protein